MSIYRITGVDNHQPEGAKVERFHIDAPVAGSSADHFALGVRGWALAPAGQRLKTVHVMVNGRPVASAQIDQLREDVERAFGRPDARTSGFALNVGLVGLLEGQALVVVAECEDGELVPLSSIRCERERPWGIERECITPILVVTQGRTGSTWLMRLLSRHPEVVTRDAFPYEDRPAQYWANLFKVLSDPADPANSADSSSFFDQYSWVGKNPFFNPDDAQLAACLGHDHVLALARFCRDSIERFYHCLGAAQGKPEARFLVEKTVGEPGAARVLRDLFPATRRVFLVRDPRDMLSSIYSYNAKRGFADFGVQSANSEEEYVRWLAQGTSNLATYWERSRGEACLVRYEDLIRHPEATLGRAFEYLGAAADKATLGATLRAAQAPDPALSAHRTSKDPKASIGRWRRDLPKPLRKLAEQAFAEVLEKFDYR